MRFHLEMRNTLLNSGRKGHPSKVAKSLAELYTCSNILLKVGLENNDTGYLAEETAKQSVEGEPWPFLKAYSKI